MQSKQKAIYTFGIIHTAFNDIKDIPINLSPRWPNAIGLSG